MADKIKIGSQEGEYWEHEVTDLKGRQKPVKIVDFNPSPESRAATERFLDSINRDRRR